MAVPFIFTLTVSHAAASTTKPPPPEDFRKMVQTVDVKDSEVVVVYMHDRSTHTYKIDFVTALKVNNVAGKIDDLKAGMVVDDYVERDNDSLDLLSVSGYGTNPTAAKPKKSAKPKPTSMPPESGPAN